MAQDDDPLISILTVNWNGKRYLDDLFNSIFSLNYPKKKLQVLMVDNNSSDDSVKYVKKFCKKWVVPLILLGIYIYVVGVAVKIAYCDAATDCTEFTELMSYGLSITFGLVLALVIAELV